MQLNLSHQINQALNAHQHRRRQGIPTLSVLVGSPITCRESWYHWIRHHNRTAITWSPYSGQSLFLVWLERLVQEQALEQWILQYLARCLNIPAEQLQQQLLGKTTYQLELFWQSLGGLETSLSSPILQWGIDHWVAPQPVAPQSVEDIARLLKAHEDPRGAISTLAELVPAGDLEQLPAILVLAAQPSQTMDPGVDPNSRLGPNLITSLTQWVGRIPLLSVAISIDPAGLESYLTTTPESRAKAILREGILPITSPSSEVITAWLVQQPIQDPRQRQGILTILTRHGATTDVLEAATALALDLQDQQSADRDPEAPYFRSQPEAFLFKILEALPTTSGLFQPNRKLDLKFGPQWMEVDLLAEALGIVIELDGYYHFQHPDQYRRDRRKDFELQKQGYLVLRFLTEDLLVSLEEILDRIQQAISIQRQRRSLPNKGSL